MQTQPGVLLGAVLLLCPPVHAQPQDSEKLTQLQHQITELKAQLHLLEQQIQHTKAQTAGQDQTATPGAASVQENSTSVAEAAENRAQDGIVIGGAVRTNFSHTSYNEGNKSRGGDFDFDIFRLNLNGSIGDVLLNSEIRFFDYMTVLKSAWVGYQFSPDWQVQAGITQVPFGNWPYNSHNYFFSPNYYLGLEDDHDLGILFKRQLADNWQLDLGFFKNDELGGVDGYVSNRADRYSYDVVGIRAAGEDIYAEPGSAIGEYNSFAARYGYHLQHGDWRTELGWSALYGGLHDGQHKAGHYSAYALHLNSHYQRWNLQLQHTRYNYSVGDAVQMAVGAYGFYDSIATDANSSNLNLAYSLPVQWGPISNLQFYNDFGLVYDKSDGSANTMMNVTGVAVTAGGLFAYIDLVHARNQPFIGGSVAGNSDDTERRFNINLGYYF